MWRQHAVVGEGLTICITSMTFPKNMRWGAYDFKFVRPIRWLVAMLGNDVIDLEVTGVKSGNVTRGHRFLGGEGAVTESICIRGSVRANMSLQISRNVKK